jgi:hypothetical protein
MSGIGGLCVASPYYHAQAAPLPHRALVKPRHHRHARTAGVTEQGENDRGLPATAALGDGLASGSPSRGNGKLRSIRIAVLPGAQLIFMPGPDRRNRARTEINRSQTRVTAEATIWPSAGTSAQGERQTYKN